MTSKTTTTAMMTPATTTTTMMKTTTDTSTTALFEEEKKEGSLHERTTANNHPSPSSPLQQQQQQETQAAAAWMALQRDAERMSASDTLREYLRLCPYVPADSPAVASCLGALDKYDRKEERHRQRQEPPLLVSRFSHDSDDDDDEDSFHGDGRNEEDDDAIVPPTTKSDASAVPDPPPPPPPRKRSSGGGSWMLWLLRVLVLDGALWCVWTLYFGTRWAHHVHDACLEPMMRAADFNNETRGDLEITYYARPCSAQDITTHDGTTLFLPSSATTEEAYQHQMLHGFTVFPAVLTQNTINVLRETIVNRNRNLKKADRLYVIEEDYRASFGLGTEMPGVVQAMMEVGNHRQLTAALEKVLGPNPALIEMTAITSSAGAAAQYYHEDVISDWSVLRYGRTFAPAYSIFVQLQNTTTAMGATSVCPGSHYCSAGDMEALCDAEGFQLVNTTAGYWRAGDALLMNMNSWHRGAAHNDPAAPDRVMLILTFAPRPVDRAESRMNSQGITFSMRWDMWGHTLRDIKEADTVMVQPWATLRSLGLYKHPRDAVWGVDYLSITMQRLVNDPNLYLREDLDDWIRDAGGIPVVPKFLHGTFPNETERGWHEYYVNTMNNVEDYLWKMCLYSSAAYLACFFLAHLLTLAVETLTSGKNKKGNANGYNVGGRAPTSMRSVLFRVVGIAGTCYAVYGAARVHVDRTGWAADIRNLRRYASALEDEASFGVLEPTSKLPSTFPTRDDVLIETRFGSSYMAMYNEFVSHGHAGNRRYRNLLRDVVSVGNFMGHCPALRSLLAQLVVRSTREKMGRFLHQGHKGAWFWMRREGALDYTRKELVKTSNPAVEHVARSLRFAFSDVQYGVYRDSAMARSHAAPYVKHLEERMWQNMEEKADALFDKVGDSNSDAMDLLRPSAADAAAAMTTTWASVPRPWSMPWTTRRFVLAVPFPSRSIVQLPLDPVPPKGPAAAWLAAGARVEGHTDDRWYPAVVRHVSPLQWYTIEYQDGEVQTLPHHMVRPFFPYAVGEQGLECLLDDGAYYHCGVVSRDEERDAYGAVLLPTSSNTYLEDLRWDELSRPPTATKKKQKKVRSAYGMN